MKTNRSAFYLKKRDYYLEDKPLAAFYQIKIIQEELKSVFHFGKKRVLKQFWYILNEILNDFLGIDDINYRKGICQEVFLSGSEYCLSEKECRICNSYFNASGIHEYVNAVYQIHIRGILDMMQDDLEAAKLYSDNLFLLLEMRYKKESIQYAKMKLHYIAECLRHYDRKEFIYMFKSNYDYFRYYMLKKDFFFLQAFIIFLVVYEGKDFDIWMTRLEEDMKECPDEGLNCLLQCEIAMVKAEVLKKEQQYKDGFILMERTICNYLCKDQDKERPYYSYVYLMAAYFSKGVSEYDKMLYYAQEGLSLCESRNMNGSEVYYNLYNFIGLWYMWNNQFAEAEKLYCDAIPKIVQQLGKENANYVLYMNNLALVALNNGKDVKPYYDEIKKVASEKWSKDVIKIIDNGQVYSMAKADSINEAMAIYKRCISNLGKEDRIERERLEIVYVSARINACIFDEETSYLLDKLEKKYENCFADELAVSYWNCRIAWEWARGEVGTALSIAENLMREANVDEYLGGVEVALNDIQLLIINKCYDRAIDRIFVTLSTITDNILKNGLSSTMRFAYYLKLLLSMYIHALKRGEQKLFLKESESKRLLEKIMLVKTLEREMESLKGKYYNDEDDMYFFKMAHRKLAALEIAHYEHKIERTDYDRKKALCLLELGKYEASIIQQIPFCKLVHQYRFEEIVVPHDAICVEYFAYFNFLTDKPLCGHNYAEGEEYCSYLAFILEEEKERTRIIEIVNIPCEERTEDEMSNLLMAADMETCEADEAELSREYLKRKFAVPVLKYMQGKNLLYLGVDCALSFLPVDIIFCDKKGIPIKCVLVDSICYAGQDKEIRMRNASALVVGNPKLDLEEEQNELSLQCGEIECNKIAEMLGTKAYIGEKASQQVLWGKSFKDIVHISVHGGFRVSDNYIKDVINGNLCIHSYLFFAGYYDWLNGRRKEGYGNGIVSGDDFLFMNFSETKLVVLSACVSALGLQRGLDIPHGMRWALSIAGVENSVTSLWNVSDEATAILMILFYRNLYSMPVGEALYHAKMRLRSMTNADLEDDRELWEVVMAARNGKAGGRERHVEGGDRPFSHWKYWAGFVCYHR